MNRKKKIVVLALGVFFLFSLLFSQYFNIQVAHGNYWNEIALSQHQTIIPEAFRRGSFYSNTSLKKGHPEKNQPFVIDVVKFHLFVDPVIIPSAVKEEIKGKLVQLLDVAQDKQESFFESFQKKSRCRKIGSYLSKQTKEEIEKWWQPFAKKQKLPLNALFFTTDYQRSYPFGTLLGQVLHTIRENKEEKTKQGLPTGGLEAYFNSMLKGKEGKRLIHRSPLNKLASPTLLEAPENGADIYLTVNHYIQAIVEEELETGVKAAGARGGWAVMMDPQTGEILALAQYPFFDPTNYRDFFNSEEKKECAKVKALTDAYELGSVMKPIIIALTLKANKELQAMGKAPLFHPEEKIKVTQTIFPGRASKPLVDTHPAKNLNLYMAIQKSSNIYVALLVERIINTLGADWCREELIKTFGFATKTGIELPGEAYGFLPTPGKKYPNGALEWSLPTPYSLAIGHNMLATGIQMVRCIALFANGGKLVNPTLVRKIVKTDHEGNEIILLDNTKPKNFPAVLEPEIARTVLKAMKYTTKEGGTCRLAEVYGYSEAGKSGTSEKIIDGVYSREKYISSFIGVAPANLDPNIPSRFVLLVSIDEPAPIYLKGKGKNYMGGRCAAPVFRGIAKRTLEYLGITPDDPYGYPPGDPRYNPDKADWLQEIRALKLLYEEWN